MVQLLAHIVIKYTRMRKIVKHMRLKFRQLERPTVNRNRDLTGVNDIIIDSLNPMSIQRKNNKLNT